MRLIISAIMDGKRNIPPPGIGYKPLNAFLFDLNGSILEISGAGNPDKFLLANLLNGFDKFASRNCSLLLKVISSPTPLVFVCSLEPVKLDDVWPELDEAHADCKYVLLLESL